MNDRYGTDKEVHNVQYLRPKSKSNYTNQMYIQCLKSIYELISFNIYFNEKSSGSIFENDKVFVRYIQYVAFTPCCYYSLSYSS